MNKVYMCIMLVFVLNLFFHCAAEIDCLEVDQLSTLMQDELDYSFEQIEYLEKNCWNMYPEMDIMFEDELIVAMDVLPESSPKVVYFFELNPDMDADIPLNAKASLFLNHSILANTMIDPMQGAYLEAMNIYGVFSSEHFSGVSYIVLYYSKELPVIVTTICEVSENQTIAKTGLVYASGEYDNSFTAFAGSLLTRFGTKSFDIKYYRASE